MNDRAGELVPERGPSGRAPAGGTPPRAALAVVSSDRVLAERVESAAGPERVEHAESLADLRCAVGSRRSAGHTPRTLFVDMESGETAEHRLAETWTLLSAEPKTRAVLCEADAPATLSEGARESLDRLIESGRVTLLRRPLRHAEVEAAVRSELGIAAVCRDRDHLAEAQNDLRHDALHDALTGLANRTLLQERIERCIERKKRWSQYAFAVLFLDLDNFKIVNDSLGHAQGDRLLECVAHRLQNALRMLDTAARPASDTIGRTGGDEFVIVLDGMHSSADAARVARRILDELEPPVDLHGERYCISCSIGIAASDAPYNSPDEVLRDADSALYEAKRRGKNGFAEFNHEMRQRVLGRLQFDADLRGAIDRDELSLQYQPIVSLSTGRILAFEALLRWMPDQYGPVSPAEFIPIAEEGGVINQFGDWVLAEACRQLEAWKRISPRLRLHLNLSPRQLLDTTFPGRIRRIAGDRGVSPNDLGMEIAETSLIGHHEAIASVVTELRNLGVEMLLDDFGTGQSSLRSLDSVHFDTVKIDPAFVGQNQDDRTICTTLNALLQLAEIRGLRTVAEGVETSDAMVRLQALGCDAAQGFFFSKPLEPEAATRLLMKRGRWGRPAA